MSDIVDDANDKAERYLATAIRLQQSKMNQMTIHYAECLYCGDSTDNGAPYCCGECRSDHEALLDARKRNGNI